MSQYVTDTHALLWHLYNNPKLSSVAKIIFEQTDAGNDEIFIPAIVLVEIIYLTEKKRIPADAVQKSLDLLTSDTDNYHIAPLDAFVARAVQSIDRAVVPELPDRIIAATALALGLPLITRDERIKSVTGLVQVW
jgi:PIN domain nuclease of toxin-antitoxin system